MNVQQMGIARRVGHFIARKCTLNVRVMLVLLLFSVIGAAKDNARHNKFVQEVEAKKQQLAKKSTAENSKPRSRR